MRLIHTRPCAPRTGSCLSPLAEETSWVAWRLEGISTRIVTDDAGVRRAAFAFEDLVDIVGVAGLASVLTEVEHRPDEGRGASGLRIRLAIGISGPRGTSEVEAAAAAQVSEELLGSTRLPFAIAREDPLAVLDIGDDAVGDAVLVRSPFVTSSVADSVDARTVSRRAPQLNPWRKVASLLAAHPQALRVRATSIVVDAPFTMIAEATAAVSAAAEARLLGHAAAADPEVERASATADAARLSRRSPVLCSEIALVAPGPIPCVTARAIAACFTTPADVHRAEGRTTVVTGGPFFGGYDLDRPEPPRVALALRAGVPLRGGIEPPDARDLHGLGESVIGWPLPDGDPIPTVPSTVTLRRLRPAGVDCGRPLGTDPAGNPVAVPWPTAARHTLVLGASGTAKTRLIELWARDHLAAGEPVYLIAPHRRVAQRVLAEAQRHRRQVHYFHVRDARSAQMSPFPRLDGTNRETVVSRCRDLAWAIASHVDDPLVAGFVYLELASSILAAASAYGVDIAAMAAWVNHSSHLQRIARHPALDANARHTLLNLAAHSGPDGAAKRDWVLSKLGPVVGPARRLFAAAGEGVDLHEAMREGVSVVVNLDGLARNDAAVIGTLVIDQLLAAGLELADDEQRRRPLFVDEAHRFHPHHLEKALAEGRKTGLGVVLATQSLAQLPPALADLALGAAVKVALRQTPESAVRLGPLLEIPAGALVDQPDFHAYVRIAQTSTCAVTIPPYDDDLVLPEPQPPGPLPAVPDAPPDVPFGADAAPALAPRDKVTAASDQSFFDSWRSGRGAGART